jgi:hypothetical protein
VDPITLAGWLPPKELNPNARVHHMARYLATRRAKLHVTVALLDGAEAAGWTPQPQDGPRRRLTITLRRPRLLDEDNAVALCKAVFDTVKEMGYLYDDSPRYAELRVVQAQVRRTASRVFLRDGEREGTTLALEEIADG